MKKLCLVVASIVVMVAIISLMVINNRKVSIEDTVDNITYLMNLRYNGLENSDKQVIEEIIPTQAKAIISKLDTSNIDLPIFISLENYFREFENAVTTDETGNIIDDTGYTSLPSERYITEVDGERGIYSDKIYVNEYGQFATVIYGQSLYVDAPEEIMVLGFKDNPIYKLKVDSYNYYDNGMLYISYTSDIIGGIKEQYEKGNISLDMDTANNDNKDDELKQQEIDTLIDDYADKKTIQNYIVAVKLKDGKIQSIDNTDIVGNILNK